MRNKKDRKIVSDGKVKHVNWFKQRGKQQKKVEKEEDEIAKIIIEIEILTSWTSPYTRNIKMSTQFCL